MSDDNRWTGGPYIRSHFGRKIPLANPSPADLRLDDIAYHLARINRYTGASQFSVAQHMVVGAVMARRFYPDHPLLPARFLIHDVPEHAIGDVSSPLKSLIPGYKELEQRWDLAVESWAGLTFVGVPEVKELDDRMWLTERLTIFREALWLGAEMDEDTARCQWEPFELTRHELTRYFEPWGARVAEEEYLVAVGREFPGLVTE